MRTDILIAGATGNAGLPLIQLLSVRGVSIRAMVRTQASGRFFERGVTLGETPGSGPLR